MTAVMSCSGGKRRGIAVRLMLPKARSWVLPPLWQAYPEGAATATAIAALKLQRGD
jgi:hypothetical protein